jgi:hypothetical protein
VLKLHVIQPSFNFKLVMIINTKKRCRGRFQVFFFFANFTGKISLLLGNTTAFICMSQARMSLKELQRVVSVKGDGATFPKQGLGGVDCNHF